MVCSFSARDLFQPNLPTASRCLTKPIRRVSSRRKCVWSSMTYWPDSAAARCSANSGVAASASLTSNKWPNTWFIATIEAALDRALLFGLRDRKVLVARDDLGRDRRRKRRSLGRQQLVQLFIAQES